MNAPTPLLPLPPTITNGASAAVMQAVHDALRNAAELAARRGDAIEVIVCMAGLAPMIDFGAITKVYHQQLDTRLLALARNIQHITQGAA